MKYLYYILFFAMPFVVLPINSELFEFNKMLFIYAMAVLIGGMWLLNKKVYIRRTPFDIPIGMFFLSQVVSALFSIDRSTSFFGYYGRFNGGLLSTFVYIFLYYAFVSNINVDSKIIIKKLFGLSIVSSILVVLWGLPGKFNHDLSCLLFTSKFDNTCWTAQFRPAERMFSTLGQPNWLGAYLSITFFMSIFFLLTSQKKNIQLLGVVGTFFTYLGILLSRSRSSLVSLVPGVTFIAFFLCYLYLKKREWFNVERSKLIGGAIGGLALITIVAQTGIPQVDSILSLSFLRPSAPVETSPAPKKQSLAVVGPITESLDIRKIVWAGAWELGKQYPLFGTGVETFGYAYYSVRPASHNLTSEWDYLYNKAHNEFLNLLATTGWFGLGSYVLFMLWIIAVLVIKLRQFKSNESVVLFLSILASIFISIWITNFFGFSITVVNVYWFLCLAFLVIYLAPEIKQEKSQFKSSLSQIGLIGIVVAWFLSSIGTYWMADYTYAQADIALKSNNTGVSVNLLQKALGMRYEHIYEDKLSYALAQYAYVVATDKDKATVLQLIDASEKLNLKSLASSSQNVLYWKTRVKNQFIYYQMSLDKKYLFTGLSALDEAQKLAPTDPKIPYFSATYYSLLFDDEKEKKQKELYKIKSLESIENTIKLKSNYGDAYYLKVQLLRKYGMKIEAKELLEWYIPRYAPGNKEIEKELMDLG